MQIIETLVVEQSPEMFSGIAEILTLSDLKQVEVPIYRFEVDPDLVILIYRLNSERRIKKEILDSILPHLKLVILLSDKKSFSAEELASFVPEQLMSRQGDVPFILALREKNGEILLPDKIKQHGLFLGEKSRMMFWNPDDPTSILRIWEEGWGDLLKGN